MKFIILLVATSVLVDSKELDDSSQPCRKNDPNFKNCFANLIERKASLLIKRSVPESNLLLLPSSDPTPFMDPYVIPYLNTHVSLRGIVEADVILKNITFMNTLRMKVINASMDLDNLSALINTVHPKLKWKLEFDAHGKLFNFPLVGEGIIIGRFVNYKSNIRIQFKTVERKGVEYFTIDNLKLDVSLEDGSVQITTKDTRYQRILHSAQNFFNRSPKEVLELTKPIHMKYTERLTKSIMEAIFSAIPANMILSE